MMKKLNEFMEKISAIIVHGGSSHVDEMWALAIALLGTKKILPVYRKEPTPEELEDSSILVLDVGKRLEPNKSNFDHHQRSRDEEPKCAFKLFCEEMGCWEFLASLFPWMEMWNKIDASGPFAVSKQIGIEADQLFGILGPLYTAACKNFEDKSKTPEQLGVYVYDTFTAMIQEAIGGLNKIRSVASWFKNGQNLRVLDLRKYDGVVPDAPLVMFVKENSGCDIVVYPPNDRNPASVTLYRWQDSPHVDFSVLGKDNWKNHIEFAHKGGFLAVTKELPTNGLLADMICSAWVE